MWVLDAGRHFQLGFHVYWMVDRTAVLRAQDLIVIAFDKPLAAHLGLAVSLYPRRGRPRLIGSFPPIRARSGRTMFAVLAPAVEGERMRVSAYSSEAEAAAEAEIVFATKPDADSAPAPFPARLAVEFGADRPIRFARPYSGARQVLTAPCYARRGAAIEVHPARRVGEHDEIGFELKDLGYPAADGSGDAEHVLEIEASDSYAAAALGYTKLWRAARRSLPAKSLLSKGRATAPASGLFRRVEKFSIRDRTLRWSIGGLSAGDWLLLSPGIAGAAIRFAGRSLNYLIWRGDKPPEPGATDAAGFRAPALSVLLEVARNGVQLLPWTPGEEARRLPIVDPVHLYALGRDLGDREWREAGPRNEIVAMASQSAPPIVASAGDDKFYEGLAAVCDGAETFAVAAALAAQAFGERRVEVDPLTAPLFKGEAATLLRRLCSEEYAASFGAPLLRQKLTALSDGNDDPWSATHDADYPLFGVLFGDDEDEARACRIWRAESEAAPESRAALLAIARRSAAGREAAKDLIAAWLQPSFADASRDPQSLSELAQFFSALSRRGGNLLGEALAWALDAADVENADAGVRAAVAAARSTHGLFPAPKRPMLSVEDARRTAARLEFARIAACVAEIEAQDLAPKARAWRREDLQAVSAREIRTRLGAFAAAPELRRRALSEPVWPEAALRALLAALAAPPQDGALPPPAEDGVGAKPVEVKTPYDARALALDAFLANADTAPENERVRKWANDARRRFERARNADPDEKKAADEAMRETLIAIKREAADLIAAVESSLDTARRALESASLPRERRAAFRRALEDREEGYRARIWPRLEEVRDLSPYRLDDLLRLSGRLTAAEEARDGFLDLAREIGDA